MYIEDIKQGILPLLDKPKTVFEMCVVTDLSLQCVRNYLKILEAAGCVKAIKTRKGTLWHAFQSPEVKV